jgi:hypothetical protein
LRPARIGVLGGAPCSSSQCASTAGSSARTTSSTRWSKTAAPSTGLLRYSALAANAAFIAYGLSAGLWPVLALHFVLVPINV